MTAPRRPGTGSEAHPDAYSPGVPGSQVAVRILGATAVVLAVALGGAPPELLIAVFGAAIFAAIRPEPIGAALSLVAVILACLGAGPETGAVGLTGLGDAAGPEADIRPGYTNQITAKVESVERHLSQ